MPEEKDYLPVYREPASYARENDELSPYRLSRRENIACKEAIEESIRKHFDGMHLDPSAVKEVMGEELQYSRRPGFRVRGQSPALRRKQSPGDPGRIHRRNPEGARAKAVRAGKARGECRRRKENSAESFGEVEAGSPVSGFPRTRKKRGKRPDFRDCGNPGIE